MEGLSLSARPYQVAAHDALFRAWGVTPWASDGAPAVDSTVLNLCTGSGKTIIAAMAAHTIVRTLGKRMLFVADSNELCAQPLQKIASCTGIFPALEKANFRASLNAEIVVASAQTLSHSRRLARFPADHFGYVFNDEAHRSVDRYAKINARFTGAKVCGLTATAFRRNLRDLKKWYQSVCYELPSFGAGGLIEQGYLTPVKVITLDIEADISEVQKDATGDYNAEQLGNVMAPLMRSVARAIRDDPSLQNRQILCFLPMVRSSVDFVRICQEEGVTARHCDGTTDGREEIVKDFESKKFQVLSNAQMFSTGVDFIWCDALMDLSPTSSPGLYRQRVGRVVRVLPGIVEHLATAEERRAAIAASAKPNALIIDVLLKFGKLGLADPASLIIEDSTELEAARAKMKKLRTPEELEEIRRLVQAEREQKVLDQWSKMKGRARELISMEVFSAIRHDARIADYVPFNDAEARPLNKSDRWALQARGIDPDTVPTQGLAALIIDTLSNSAPHHAWAALRAHGHPNPERMSLDDSIRALRDGFPMGLGGDRYLGKPFREVPLRFWERCYDEWRLGSSWMDNYPAEKRYMRKVVETARGNSSALVQKQLTLV